MYRIHATENYNETDDDSLGNVVSFNNVKYYPIIACGSYISLWNIMSFSRYVHHENVETHHILIRLG